METISKKTAAFIHDTKWEDLSEEAIASAKLLLLDSIGCHMSSLDTDLGKMYVAFGKKHGAGSSSIIGTGYKASLDRAVMVNAQLMNATDFDSLGGRIHTPPYLLPIAVSVAEEQRKSGKDLILALAIGYNVAGSLENLFGGMAAAARLFDLDTETIEDALGLCAHMCIVKTIDRFDACAHRAASKYAVAGYQAVGSLDAVLLAMEGCSGDRTFFDTKPDFWDISGWPRSRVPDRVELSREGEITNARIIESLTEKWIIEEAGYKRIPCCGVANNAAILLGKMLDIYDLTAKDVERVDVWGGGNMDLPLFNGTERNSIVDVQFSPGNVLAMVANRLKPGADWMDYDAYTSDAVISFSKKVHIQSNPDFARTHMTIVKVMLKDGTVYQDELADPLLMPPLITIEEEEVIEKFRHNCQRTLTQKKINQTIDMVMNLENVTDVNELITLITL